MLILISFFLTSVNGIAHAHCCDDGFKLKANSPHDCCDEPKYPEEGNARIDDLSHEAEPSKTGCSNACCAIVAIPSEFSFTWSTNGVLLKRDKASLLSSLEFDLLLRPPRSQIKFHHQINYS